MTLCVTIATNLSLTDGLLINYTRIGSAFNKLSENIYFYILTLLIMAVVFDFLRAISEYWFRKKNGISWGTFWFQIGEYERVKNNVRKTNAPPRNVNKGISLPVQTLQLMPYITSRIKQWAILSALLACYSYSTMEGMELTTQLPSGTSFPQ